MDSLNIEVKKIIEMRDLHSDFHSRDVENNFNNKHPIFKTLMKLEFEKAIRNYLRCNETNHK